MDNSQISVNDFQALQKRLENNPGVILESLQESYQANMSQIIEALPQTMWRRIDGSHFMNVLQQVSTIGSVVVITNTPDAILEYKGPFPPGEFSHGFYNLQGDKIGLHGHLRPQRCKEIYFVQRPFMKKATASIIFTNLDGNTIFKIFLGRDETGEICVKQLAMFNSLAELS